MKKIKSTSKSLLLIAAVAATPLLAPSAHAYTPPGLTSNEAATYNAVSKAHNAGHLTSQEFHEILTITLNDGIPLGNDEISPIALAPMRQMAFSNNNVFYGALTSHFDDIRNNVPEVTTTTTPSMSKDGKDKNPVVMQTEEKWSFWTSGLGGFTTIRDSVNSYGYQPGSVSDMGGIVIGLDYRVSQNLVFGILGSYQNAEANDSNLSNSPSPSRNLMGGSEIDLNSGKLGVYGTWFQNGAYVQGYVGGGYDNYDTTRDIAAPAFGPFNYDTQAKGNTNAGEVNALLGGGYDWTFGGFKVGPTAQAQYTYVGISGFNESGADVFDLKVHDQNAQSLMSLVGLRAQYTWDLGGGRSLVPFASVKWEHEFLQNSRGISADFAGEDFTVQTAKPGDDGALVDAGVNFTIKPGIALFAAYQGEFFRTNYNSQGVFGGVRFNF